MDRDNKALTAATECMRYQGMTVVPHYTQSGVFVIPGGRHVTRDQLIRAGAVPTIQQLWPRIGQ